MELKVFIHTMEKLKRNFCACQLNFRDPDVYLEWYELLGNFTMQDLGRACKQAIAECEFFPSAAKLKILAGGANSDQDAKQIFADIWNCFQLGNDPISAQKRLSNEAWTCAQAIGRWADMLDSASVVNSNFRRKEWMPIIKKTLGDLRAGRIALPPSLEEQNALDKAVIPERKSTGRPGGEAGSVMERMQRMIHERELQDGN